MPGAVVGGVAGAGAGLVGYYDGVALPDGTQMGPRSPVQWWQRPQGSPFRKLVFRSDKTSQS